mmetsp:Transcript_18702/g.46733  ORF Transcript_18702/g.46733 Transcript_18702/m.46733 type:complete len:128 (+) Transcript_18702:3-386(+)
MMYSKAAPKWSGLRGEEEDLRSHTLGDGEAIEELVKSEKEADENFQNGLNKRYEAFTSTGEQGIEGEAAAGATGAAGPADGKYHRAPETAGTPQRDNRNSQPDLVERGVETAETANAIGTGIDLFSM